MTTIEGMPLDEDSFRLLTLLPALGGPEEDLKCTLHLASLTDPPEFSALSYAWGDPEIRTTIFINGLPVEITQNLDEALRHLRKQTEPIDLWVDALCINQADEVEKAQQVLRMHRIYTCSTQTITWLGPAADGSGMAIAALDRVGKEAGRLGLMSWNPLFSLDEMSADERKKTDDISRALEEYANTIRFDFPFKAARKLALRPYWGRLWIMQEYTLAERVILQCGHDTMSADDFGPGYLFLAMLIRSVLQTYEPEDMEEPFDPSQDYEQEIDDDNEGKPAPRIWQILNNAPVARIAGLINIRRRYVEWEANLGIYPAMHRLFFLLEKAHVARNDDIPLATSVAKDRVYGLLGMLGDIPELGFDVDYEASDEKIFTDVSRTIFTSGLMLLLSYARIHKEVDMPSWAVDWRAEFLNPSAETNFFRPSGSAQAGGPVPKGNDILTFEGLIVDTICHLDVAWEPKGTGVNFIWEDAHRFIQAVEELVSSTEDAFYLPIEFTLERWREGIWRIPIADQYTSDLGTRIRATERAQVGWEMVAHSNGELPEELRIGVNDQSFYQIAMSRLNKRRLVQTQKGFVGLAPVDAQVGDWICILIGAESPTVLRPVHERDAFQIVGEAYVYGIMDGELLSEDTPLDSFDIC